MAWWKFWKKSKSKRPKTAWAYCAAILYWSVLIILPLSLIVSIPWEFMRLYQEEVAKSAAVSLQGVPAECRPDQMNAWEQARAWGVWVFSWTNNDSCEKYHNAVLVDPIWRVSPMMVLVSAGTRCLVHPVEHISSSLGLAIRSFMQHIPLQWQPVVMVVGVLCLVLAVLMAGGYRIAMPFFLSIEPAKQDNSKNDSRKDNRYQAITQSSSSKDVKRSFSLKDKFSQMFKKDSVKYE